MRLSENKIAQLSHVVYDALSGCGQVDITADDAAVRRELKHAVARFLGEEEELEESVRRKVLSYSKNIREGSPEWDILFQKHYREEQKKRGRL